jgi:hypothetical protein
VPPNSGGRTVKKGVQKLASSFPGRVIFMSPAARKPALRKAMRVATLFTGVTTCAAAFTPAANDQAATNITNEPRYSSLHAGNRNTWLTSTLLTHFPARDGEVQRGI